MAYYTIQAGDTLSGIARKLGVTVDAIVQANNIANPSLIHPGQVLTIPGAPQPPAPPTPPAPQPMPNLKDLIKGPPFPRFNLKDPTAMQPDNLITNGSMGAGFHSTPYGDVVNGWQPFIVSGNPPNFRHVDNEQIDPGGSQQLYSSDTFDAGICQTVKNLQPGTYYMFRLGYSLAAKSVDGPNFRVQTIGRQVGVDPFGGMDPKSATVIWGNQFFNGQAALNIPDMQMIFPVLSTQATIFLRAIATDAAQGENRVWLDAVCMEPRSEIPAIDVSKYRPPSPPPPTPSSNTYTIQSGDTLSAIARKFGVTVDALVQANNIANPSLIKPGQVLRIPK